MKYLLTIILSFMLSYLCFVFITMHVNPAVWTEDARAAMTAIGLVMSLAGCFVVKTEE